eukprot:scaffold348462_cov62-Attheya_sp.AAC.6
MIFVYLSHQNSGWREILPPAVNVVNVLIIRIRNNVKDADAVVVEQHPVNTAALRQRHRSIVIRLTGIILRIRNLRRSGLAKSVDHEVAPGPHNAGVKVGDANVVGHLEGGLAVVQAGSVVHVIDYGDPAAFGGCSIVRVHEPRPIVARPVRVRGADDPLDGGRVDAHP